MTTFSASSISTWIPLLPSCSEARCSTSSSITRRPSLRAPPSFPCWNRGRKDSQNIEYLSAGVEYLSAGVEYLSAGVEYLSAGVEYLSAGWSTC